ncbi:ABC transporter ATP-binding protein [Qiania dongpingensis]|uniref:ABC transporter ATP-binding protein n=1 Tax=Qiania dongpingensis TaxID=2763669 RepID=A0A7G9G500_9FIRM|nr:ABC transporter ATP-binding protein [Qiania dongpingensis]QNM05882.1 ABC transporter ATP-binding protein [Qiania dongpingensis]
MASILECRNLEKSYDGGRTKALKGVSLSLGKGRIIGLLGPNGSGKTTFIKLINGLLTPEKGELYIGGYPVGEETKRIISYLPEVTYLNKSMRIHQIIDYFRDFYDDFDTTRAYEMLKRLNIDPQDRMKTMSKGTKEKVQLIMVMSRNASLYVLDEPIGGVDPAARDYILSTIVSNYNPEATILISTHLIADVEQILDDVIFLKDGNVVMAAQAENLRKTKGCSIDATFREVFRC